MIHKDGLKPEDAPQTLSEARSLRDKKNTNCAGVMDAATGQIFTYYVRPWGNEDFTKAWQANNDYISNDELLDRYPVSKTYEVRALVFQDTTYERL